MKLRRALVPTSMIAALSLASCGGGGGGSTSTETVAPSTEPTATAPSPRASEAGVEHLERAVKVKIQGFAYEPDPVRVQVGGKVIWQNEDSTAHTATADDGSFDTGPIEEGKIQSETFKSPGTFAYHCSIHPSMHGTIEVVPAE